MLLSSLYWCVHTFIVALYLQDVGDNSNRPAVHCLAVGLLCQNFRSWKWVKNEHFNKACTQRKHRYKYYILSVLLCWCHTPVCLTQLSVHTSFIRQTRLLTYISRRAAGCRHDVVVYHLGEAEITDHDLGVLLLAEVQDVLWLHRDKQTGQLLTHWHPRWRTYSKCYFTCGGTHF